MRLYRRADPDGNPRQLTSEAPGTPYGLDEYQSAAVAHGAGPALVLAGPDSGKTAVIVERTVRLIDEGHARSDQLLVLTFSRKAASALRARGSPSGSSGAAARLHSVPKKVSMAMLPNEPLPR